MAKKSKNLSKTKKTAYAVLIPLIVLTLGFIFYSSTLSKNESLDASNKFAELFGEMIDAFFALFTDEKLSIRKLAHFAEYCILGIEVSALAHFTAKKNIQTLGNILLLGISASVADEAIQILSNRGPAITDVLIDLMGYGCGYAIVAVISLITLLVKKVGK